MRLYAPTASSEVGVSQRHSGMEGSGVVLKLDGTPATSSRWIQITGIDYLRMEGIEIDGSNSGDSGGTNLFTMDAALADSATDLRFEGLILHDYTVSSTATGAQDFKAFNIREANTKISNTVIYDMFNYSTDASSDNRTIHNYDVADDLYVHNVTIYNIQLDSTGGSQGINQTTGTVTAKNVFIGKVENTGGGSAVGFTGTITQATNVTFDTSATGTAGDSKTDYYAYFVNPEPATLTCI